LLFYFTYKAVNMNITFLLVFILLTFVLQAQVPVFRWIHECAPVHQVVSLPNKRVLLVHLPAEKTNDSLLAATQVPNLTISQFERDSLIWQFTDERHQAPFLNVAPQATDQLLLAGSAQYSTWWNGKKMRFSSPAKAVVAWLNCNTSGAKVLAIKGDSPSAGTHILADSTAGGSGMIAGHFDNLVKAGKYELRSACVTDVFIAGFSGKRKFTWANVIGGPGNDKAQALISLANGTRVLAAEFELGGTIGRRKLKEPDSGRVAGVLALFDKTGKLITGLQCGESPANYATLSLAAAPDSGFYVAGAVSPGAVFQSGDGTDEWIYSSDIQGDSDAPDAFLARYNSSGVMEWIRVFGGAGADRAVAVAVDSAGNAMVAAHCSKQATFDHISFDSLDSVHLVMVKYNAAGTLQFARPLFGNRKHDTLAATEGGWLLAGYPAPVPTKAIQLQRSEAQLLVGGYVAFWESEVY
jgi:hypothetical protein